MLFGGDDPGDEGGLRLGVVLSVVLHVAVVVVSLVGLPFLTREPPEVEQFVMVMNPQIADVTAAPPPAPKKADKPTPPPAKVDSPTPKPEPVPEPPKPTPPKPEPPAPEPPKPAPAPKPPEAKKEEPKPKPPEPPKKEEPKKPEPKPEAKPEPKPEAKPEPKPEPPKKEEPKPKPPEPKKEEAKKPEPPKKEEPKKVAAKEPDPFDSLLKTVEEMKDKPSSAPPKTDPAPARGSTASTEAASDQVAQAKRYSAVATASEEEAIRSHVQPHWFLDAGMKGISELYVEIFVRVAPDGTVLSAEVASSAPPGTERQFKAFAESARRAVLKASPFPAFAGKFPEMTLVFRPEDAL